MIRNMKVSFFARAGEGTLTQVEGYTLAGMKVVLRNPRREVEVPGGRRVKEILKDLDIIPETVLVIRGDTLITHDQVVQDSDTIELRPVMSGGSA
jgi:sulfur carrier protein